MNSLKNIIAIMLVLIAAHTLNAKVWRLDNNVSNSADFHTWQDAYDGSAAGDTIYVSGSGVAYGDIVIDKKLALVGPGYFLHENLNAQSSLILPATFGTVTINQNAAGTDLTGLTIHTTTVNAEYTVIKRCRSTWLLTINADNCMVLGNYFSHEIDSWVSYNSLYSNNNNIYIIGNHFYSNNMASSTYYINSINIDANGSANIANNVIWSDYWAISAYNSTIHNNIVRYGNVSLINCYSTNNMGQSTQFGTANGNLSSVDIATVFIGSPAGTTDGQWKLKEGSPAIGAGTNGGDMGMFAGEYPYVLSGVPEMPYITYLYAPASATAENGLSVHVKAQSGKSSAKPKFKSLSIKEQVNQLLNGK